MRGCGTLTTCTYCLHSHFLPLVGYTMLFVCESISKVAHWPLVVRQLRHLPASAWCIMQVTVTPQASGGFLGGFQCSHRPVRGWTGAWADVCAGVTHYTTLLPTADSQQPTTRLALTLWLAPQENQQTALLGNLWATTR